MPQLCLILNFGLICASVVPQLCLKVGPIDLAHRNEYLIQKEKRIACAFIENSLFYTRIHTDEREFVISILPNAKLSTGPRALLQFAFDLVNLLGHCSSVPLRPLTSGRENYM